MYKQGEILLIPVPFSDLTSNKQRPVMVLSRHGYNIKTDDLIVAAITSNISNKDYEVVFNDLDLESGNLKVLSCIRADKIYTLSQKIVIKRFGKLKRQTVDLVKKKIDQIMTEQ